MDWIQALIMGIVQGLSEYLPISSSGHLVICSEILGLDMTGAESVEFDVMLHVATVLSTIVVLWKEFMPLCTSFFTFKRDYNFYYVMKILLSCIPVAIVGLLFKSHVEALFGSGLAIVGACLCGTAALLTFSYFYRTSPATAKAYTPHDITWSDAFIIGCAQAVAVLPGLSRSGSTIATGIILGADREKVAKFSFFMVIIPILGEALLGIKDLITDGPTGDTGFIPMIVGFLASFTVGCAACRWMINIVKKGKLIWFAVYCLIAGITALIYAL